MSLTTGIDKNSAIKRVALLSDIHANVSALNAVLEDAGLQEVQAVWVLGDLLGYGPDPVDVVKRLREVASYLPFRAIAGNHDAYLLGCRRPSDLSEEVQRVLWLHEQVLKREWDVWTWYQNQVCDKDKGCQELKTWQEDNVLWVFSHAGIERTRDGELKPASDRHYPLCWQRDFLHWLYYPLEEYGEGIKRRIVLTGHTHVPSMVIVREGEEGIEWREALLQYEEPLPLFPKGSLATVINPGSVGQPRDGDKRASYAILDWEQEQLVFRRVPYDVDSVVERMEEQRYPKKIIKRLRDAPVIRWTSMLSSPRGRYYETILRNRLNGTGV